jgi:chloramphenicol 3-O-phosphotransferase
VEAARDAGVNLAFLSGNEILEDPVGEFDRRERTTYRTLVTYETPRMPSSTRRTRRPGPEPGWIRGSARRPTVDARRTGSAVSCSTSTAVPTSCRERSAALGQAQHPGGRSHR